MNTESGIAHVRSLPVSSSSQKHSIHTLMQLAANPAWQEPALLLQEKDQERSLYKKTAGGADTAGEGAGLAPPPPDIAAARTVAPSPLLPLLNLLPAMPFDTIARGTDLDLQHASARLLYLLCRHTPALSPAALAAAAAPPAVALLASPHPLAAAAAARTAARIAAATVRVSHLSIYLPIYLPIYISSHPSIHLRTFLYLFL